MRYEVPDALAPAGSVVEFDAEEHRYFVDGKEKPSVTRIIKDEGLSIDYSAVDEATLNAAAERGTDVHHGCGLISLFGWRAWKGRSGELMRRICEEVPAHRWHYLEAFANWAELYNWRALHIERVVYSRIHDYIGTLDGWGMVDLPGGATDVPVLPDIKTRVCVRGDGYQTAAYLSAFIEQIEANHYDGQKAPAEFYNTARGTLELVAGHPANLVWHKDAKDLFIFRAAALMVNVRSKVDHSARCR